MSEFLDTCKLSVTTKELSEAEGKKKLEELNGAYRQLGVAHTLCVTAQLPRSVGGGEGKACYIDT